MTSDDQCLVEVIIVTNRLLAVTTKANTELAVATAAFAVIPHFNPIQDAHSPFYARSSCHSDIISTSPRSHLPQRRVF